MPPTQEEPRFAFTPQAEQKLADAMGLPPQNVNAVWSTSGVGKRTFLTLPSGQTCWAVVLGLQGVLETGVLGEADTLTGFVGKEYVRKVRGAKGKPDGETIDAERLMRDPSALQKILKMVDGLVPHIVLEPSVKCHYRPVEGSADPNETVMIPQEERRPGQVYTDMIGLEDKMFLFNFAVSAIQDAETFRKESASAVGDMADGEDVPTPAQHPDGSRPERRAKRRRPSRRTS